MDDSVFRRVLRELEIHKEKIKVIVLYHGGEPLLNKNFFSMIDEIRNISRDFMIKTVTQTTYFVNFILSEKNSVSY